MKTKRYIVGKCTPGSVRAGKHIRWWSTLHAAENHIARIEKHDPEGVHRGDYYIDGPCSVKKAA